MRTCLRWVLLLYLRYASPVCVYGELSYCCQWVYRRDFFNKVVSKFLSAFRKGYSCETVLAKMIEDWRKCLSEHKIVAAMLIDLSKAFDCLPHRILLSQLSAYGISNDSCNLLMSYLSERRQRVKIGNSGSSWSEIIKGVPYLAIVCLAYLLTIFLCYWKCV